VAHGLDPDVLTIGKAIGGGVPIGACGFTEEVAERILTHTDWDTADVGGVSAAPSPATRSRWRPRTPPCARC